MWGPPPPPPKRRIDDSFSFPPDLGGVPPRPIIYSGTENWVSTKGLFVGASSGVKHVDVSRMSRKEAQQTLDSFRLDLEVDKTEKEIYNLLERIDSFLES